MIKQAMVLAAGKGKRLGTITQTIPKPLVPLLGEVPLWRCLDRLQRAGVEKAVVNMHHLHKKIETAVAQWKAQNQGKMEVVLSFESETLLETGGGLRWALDHFDLNAPCLIVNSDIIWNEGFVQLVQKMSAQYQEKEMDAFLALTPYAQTTSFREVTHGDFYLKEDGKLTFIRQPHAEKEEEVSLSVTKNNNDLPYVYCGVSIMNPKAVLAHPKGVCFSLLKVWRQLYEQNMLFGFPHDYMWVDMGTPKGFSCAERLIEDEKKQCKVAKSA